MGKKFYNCIPEVVLIMTGIQKVAELEKGVKVTKSNFFKNGLASGQALMSVPVGLEWHLHTRCMYSYPRKKQAKVWAHHLSAGTPFCTPQKGVLLH